MSSWLTFAMLGTATVLAVLALRIRNLLAVIALLSAFSLLMAALFVAFSAMDVAFVEAVLGAGLSGLLLLVLVAVTGDKLAEASRPPATSWALAAGLVGLVGVMVWANRDLPDRSDPDAPAHRRVAAEYIERAEDETGTPNVVTAALADFRSQDTLGEVLVVFTAGASTAVLIAGGIRSRRRDQR